MKPRPAGDVVRGHPRAPEAVAVLLVHTPHRVVGAENGDRATQAICFVSAPACGEHGAR